MYEKHSSHADEAPASGEHHKKAWVTPLVSESPVNECTQFGFTGTGGDNTSYS